MKLVDYFFHYKFVCRNLLIHNLNCINYFHIPKINKLILAFSIRDIENLDDVSISRCFFLLKFFFGRNAYFIKYKSKFHLNVWYYSFIVQFLIHSKELYFILFYFKNDLIPFLNKNYLSNNFTQFSLNYYILDNKIFMEKKANFFHLTHYLSMKIFLSKEQDFVLMHFLKYRY